MSILFAQNSFLRVGEESSWGTEQATTTQDIKVISSTLQVVQERERTTHLSVPTSGMQSGTFEGFRNAGGSIEIPAYYDGIGVLIKAALGSLTTTGGSAPYTHTYTPASTLADSREDFLGMKVNTMTISAEAGSEMTISFDLIGKDADARAANIVSDFPSHDEILHFEAGSLSLGSSFAPTSLDIRSFELTLSNAIDRRNLLGSKLTGEPVFTDLREVTMSVTCDVTDNTLYNASLAGTQDDISLQFTRTADTNHHFKMTLSNATIEDYNDNITAFGRVERTFTFRGTANATNAGLTIEIKNGSANGLYGDTP
jgi:hypothetical protein